MSEKTLAQAVVNAVQAGEAQINPLGYEAAGFDEKLQYTKDGKRFQIASVIVNEFEVPLTAGIPTIRTRRPLFEPFRPD